MTRVIINLRSSTLLRILFKDRNNNDNNNYYYDNFFFELENDSHSFSSSILRHLLITKINEVSMVLFFFCLSYRWES